MPGSLGAGKDGTVYFVSGGDRVARAVKVFQRDDLYRQEARVYQRLAEHGVKRLAGHSVPVLVDHDDELGVIEMTVVTPPYILDFASCALDAAPVFPSHVVREREAHWLSVFGMERWRRVQGILSALRRMGIHYMDPNKKNIAFSREEEAAWEAAMERDGEDGSSSPMVDADMSES